MRASDNEGRAQPHIAGSWNPQGYGAPDIPANSAQAYYPGDRYVDVVGNDTDGDGDELVGGGIAR